jgi:ribosomal protein L7/L12
MYVEDQVYQLQQKVAKLERQIAFLMQTLALEYQDEPDAVSPEIIDLLQRGKKIQAIKLYRETSGASLKAAKAFIESLE